MMDLKETRVAIIILSLEVVSFLPLLIQEYRDQESLSRSHVIINTM